MPLSTDELMELYAQYGNVEVYPDSRRAKIILDANHGPREKDFRSMVSVIKQKFRAAGYEIEEMLEPIDPSNPTKARKHINNFVQIEAEGRKSFQSVISFKKMGDQMAFFASVPQKNLALSAPMADITEVGSEVEADEEPQVQKQRRRRRFGLC